jgi:MFS transporter, FHS family, L-fucose permease
MAAENVNKYRSGFVVVTALFFMWGFITVLNDILIPYLKGVFELSYFEAMLVQGAFFGAYFVGGLLYFIISVNYGDPINKIGYKNGIILGLGISALGTALFFPAAQFEMYGFFLSALFVLGLGFAMLQIAANPYVAILGSSDTASSRLNLSQGFNSFGTTIGPILGGFFILEYFGGLEATGASSVILPYLFLTVLLLLLALFIWRAKLPVFTNKEVIQKGAGAMKYRQLRLGAIAIFVYVGAEVAIGSILISYFGLPEIAGLSEADASPLIAFYWGGAMIGRFLGSIALSKASEKKKWLGMIGMAIGAFLVVYGSVYLKTGIGFGEVTAFLVFVGLNLLAFRFGRSLPGRSLMIFAIVPIILLVTTMLTSGAVAMWTVLGIGIFNSIMWSNIFTLAIHQLKENTSQGSSVLIMSIVGGAIIPPLQGAAADIIGVQLSFVVPIICYVYLAYYGWKGHIPSSVTE